MNTGDLCESILDALMTSWADDKAKSRKDSREQSLAVIRGVVEPVTADLERRLEMARGALVLAKKYGDYDPLSDAIIALSAPLEIAAPLAPVEGGTVDE